MDPGAVVKVLYCGANPVDKHRNHLDLGREFKRIQLAVRNTAYVVWPEYAVGPSDLTDLLLVHEPQIVHFGLHGARNRETTSGHGRDFGPKYVEPGLVLTGKDGVPAVVSASALREVFAAFSGHVECVVLNACYSEAVARELCGSVDHVIGMSAAIPDDVAVAFAEQFYTSLVRGKTYKVAFEQARSRLALEERGGFDLPRLVQRAGQEHARPRPRHPGRVSYGDERRADTTLQPVAHTVPAPRRKRLGRFVLPSLAALCAGALGLFLYDRSRVAPPPEEELPPRSLEQLAADQIRNAQNPERCESIEVLTTCTLFAKQPPRLECTPPLTATDETKALRYYAGVWLSSEPKTLLSAAPKTVHSVRFVIQPPHGGLERVEQVTLAGEEREPRSGGSGGSSTGSKGRAPPSKDPEPCPPATTLDPGSSIKPLRIRFKLLTGLDGLTAGHNVHLTIKFNLNGAQKGIRGPRLNAVGSQIGSHTRRICDWDVPYEIRPDDIRDVGLWLEGPDDNEAVTFQEVLVTLPGAPRSTIAQVKQPVTLKSAPGFRSWTYPLVHEPGRE